MIGIYKRYAKVPLWKGGDIHIFDGEAIGWGSPVFDTYRVRYRPVSYCGVGLLFYFYRYMKYILLPCLILWCLPATAQTYENLVASGKKMVKEERAKFGNDFSAAIVVLKEALKMNPNGQEAHYYLGSAYTTTAIIQVLQRYAILRKTKQYRPAGNLRK